MTRTATLGAVAVDPAVLLAQAWDYVIVGGGSAGCVLARRLSAGSASVLLIEAGKEVRDAAVESPPAWPSLSGGAYDWCYSSTPQAGLGGRTVAQPRGKGLGGSTLINALGFQRGPLGAYDRWAHETGDAGWSAASLLPYFKQSETASGGGSEWRGDSGPLHVLDVGDAEDRNAYATAFAQSAIASGHAPNRDWNGARADGTVWTQLTMRDGGRDTAASAFLDPVRERPNLAVLTGAFVLRLALSGTRCDGVEIAIDGRTARIAARETILAAGAIDSPRLLLLSGIGDAASLRRHGIATTVDLPGVGKGLKDHLLMAGLCFRATRPMPASRYNHCESLVVATTRGATMPGNMMLMALALPFLLPGIGSAPPDAFSIVPALLDPRSSGTVTLTDGDPRSPSLIDPNYLAEDADVVALVEGVEMARAIAVTGEMRAWVASEVFPGSSAVDTATLAAHVRRSAAPFYHPTSTCRMGRDRDPDAVLNPACQVRGLERLSVVDASAFPSIPQAMTNAAVLALAERASSLICAAG